MNPMSKLKESIKIIKKGELSYILDKDNRPVKFKPWLSDCFSFLYDFIMSKSVIPKKLGADIQKHYDTLTEQLACVHEKSILELGTGSGIAVKFLNNDNQYTGTDISPGLLKQAVRKFAKAGFPDPEFYVVSGDDLPFESASFDICLCILTLNFIGNVEKVFQEVDRILAPGGAFICSVPVPERNKRKSTIHGNLHSESELKEFARKSGLKFESIPRENGALLYFKVIKEEKI